MVSSKWSVFVLVCWLFLASILMQSYTANLSAILTVDQLNFAFKEEYYVGYNNGSFIKDFLTGQLHINETKLRAYSSVDDYHHAMSLGGKNGGVDVIFDEIPYMKLLMIKYDSQYKIVGPTYRTDGLGFAFPRGSPLVVYFSRAILNVTQGPTMSYLETKNFGPGYSSQEPLSASVSQGTPSLSVSEFAGLFFIAGSSIAAFVICSLIEQKLPYVTKKFLENRFGSNGTQVHSIEGASVAGDATPHGGGDEEGHEFTQSNVNPPPTQGQDALLVEGTPRQDDNQEAGGTVMNDEFIAAEHVGSRTENRTSTQTSE